jgi:hypothetical protein
MPKEDLLPQKLKPEDRAAGSAALDEKQDEIDAEEEEEPDDEDICDYLQELQESIGAELDRDKIERIVRSVTDPAVFAYISRPDQILDDFGTHKGPRLHAWIRNTVVFDHKDPEKNRNERWRTMIAYGFWIAELYYRPDLLREVRKIIAMR